MKTKEEKNCIDIAGDEGRKRKKNYRYYEEEEAEGEKEEERKRIADMTKKRGQE